MERHFCSSTRYPIRGENVAQIDARAVDIAEEQLGHVREHLFEYAAPLFVDAAKTPLPPFRAINHEIPIINENQVYTWRSSRCPEALRQQWVQKKKDYLATERWKVTTARNTVPMRV